MFKLFTDTMSTIVVPFTRCEWMSVMVALKNPYEERNCVKAADIVNMWHVRQGQNMPMIFHLTEHILDCEISDRRTDFTDSVAAKALQSNYATCIIRCVNYVSEVCQQANGLQSIANAVSHMDIPEWIVGIRHRATHNTMPPLEVFRRGLAFFRSWLWTKYWSKPLEEAIAVAVPKLVQEQRLAIDRSHDDERACRDVLSDFVKWRNLDPSSMIDDPTKDSKFNAISAKIDQMPDVMTKFLVKNVFTMSMAKLKECDIAFTLDNGVWKMPHAFQLYWSPVIILYMQKQMMTKLISVFVKYMFEKDTPVMISQQCSGWVHSLCDMILKLINFDIETTEMAEWRIIANQMLNNAGAFRDDTIRLVLNKVPVYSKKKTEQLIRLIELRKVNGKAKGEGGDGIASRNFKIAERNLKFCAKDGAISASVLPDDTTGPFRVAQINFEEVPLGLYPGQSADMLDLTLD